MNITIPRLELGNLFSILGTEVKCVTVLDHGWRGGLSGVQIATLESEAGDRYKMTRWNDGSVYRITKEN